MNKIPHRQNNFDFVRVLAALFVIISHQYALLGLREPLVFNVYSLGGLGVLLFFSISGYLVSQSWHADPNIVRFGIKRFLRIWPAYAVTITLTAIVAGPLVSTLPLADYYAHPLVGGYFNNLLFRLRTELPLTFAGNALPGAINGSLWTIPIEVKCYLLLGLLGMAGWLRRRWLVILSVLALVSVYACVWIDPFGFGICFLAGASIQRFDLLANGRRALPVLGLCGVAAALAYATDMQRLSLWFAVPVITVLIGTASTPCCRRVARFGDVSYGLYLYAFPVQQIIIWQFKQTLPLPALFMLVIATTCALAFASWHLVEKRMLQLKPRRRDAATGSALNRR